MTTPDVRVQVEQYRELSPTQVALELAHLSRQLQKLSDDQRPLEDDAVQAREAYTLAYAKRFMEEEGNNEERKQATIKMTHDLRIAAELAEVLVKMHIQQVNTLKKRIDIARSAAALVRAEWEIIQEEQRINRGSRR